MSELSGRPPRELQADATRTARRVFVLAGAAVAALSLMPPPADTPLDAVPGFDKLVHLAMYATLGVLALPAWPAAPRWRIALALAAYGVALEFTQGLVPGRMPSLADAVANCTGISIMLGIAAVRARRREAAACSPRATRRG
ncbi:MAG: VanZ family protein [Gammaproteobacteria bacterium]|nr:VanZ family protein [Gammaproteobacteria bacterium]